MRAQISLSRPLCVFVTLCEIVLQCFRIMVSHEDTKARRLKLSCRTVGVLTLCLCGFVRANPPEAGLPEKHRAFFKAHCLDCHDSETREGEVDLESLSFRITTVEQAELWQKVLNALNSGAKMFMADFEDASSPTFGNMMSGQINMRDYARGNLTLKTDKKSYALNTETATMLVRPRGWHLEERHITVCYFQNSL